MQSNFSFRLMALEFRLRDVLDPPAKILNQAGVEPGMAVLDFGCGPGGFALAAVPLVGPAGKVYAVDIHPLALRRMQQMVAQKHLPNLQVVHGYHLDELPFNHIDLALFFDVLHDLEKPETTLRTVHRLLKEKGRVSIKDHHLQPSQIEALMTKEQLYRPLPSTQKTMLFERLETPGCPL